MALIYSTVHYKCAFRLLPNTKAVDWVDIIKTIRYWLSKNRNAKFDTEELGQRWFFIGGKTKSRGTNRSTVQVATEVNSGTFNRPRYWALRFEHQDSDFQFRRWCTDIGVTILEDGGFDFSLILSHQLSAGYLGEEPDLPEPTAPKLVSLLLDNVKWRVYAGSLLLENEPVPLAASRVHSFWDQLKDPERKVPIILLIPEKGTSAIKVDTGRLAKLLAGTAVLYVATYDAYRELSRVIPDEYRCYAGYIRIYEPGLHFNSPNDPKRHRYFSKADIEEYTSSKIEYMIVRSIARHERRIRTEAVTTLEDVTSKTRELRLLQLRREGKSTDEWIKLLQDDNEDLRDKIKQLENANLSLEIKLEEYEHNLKAMQHKMDSVEKQTSLFRVENQNLSSQLNVLNFLQKLPDTLTDVIEVIEKLHPDKLYFTTRAKESAKRAKFKDAHIAWRCLWSMATVLHPLYFDSNNKGVDIEHEFESRTGLGLARGESKQTRRDKHLMGLRKDTYNGKEIDISPHVSCDKGNQNSLRIHFCIHAEDKRLVVGHCGDHLVTSGTRRKS